VVEVSACVKRSKRWGEELWSDTLARIRDLDLRLRRGRAEPHLDPSARRRELDRVRQKVRHDLLQAEGVPAHRVGDGQTGESHADGLRLGGRADLLDGALNHRDEVDGLRIDTDVAAHDPRDVQKVVDEARQRLRVALDGVDRVQCPGRAELTVAEETRPAQDRVQGGAELVGDDGEALVFEPICRSVGVSPDCGPGGARCRQRTSVPPELRRRAPFARFGSRRLVEARIGSAVSRP
jgi:hypothetical protein